MKPDNQTCVECEEWRAIATRDITAERGSLSATLGDRYAVLGPGAYASVLRRNQELEQQLHNLRTLADEVWRRFEAEGMWPLWLTEALVAKIRGAKP